MLVGMKCKVGNGMNAYSDKFEFFEGVIASEPLINRDSDFFVLVLTGGKLTKVDTDYIYDITER